eukprot:7385294-Prymnesium_polylepis.1
MRGGGAPWADDRSFFESARASPARRRRGGLWWRAPVADLVGDVRLVVVVEVEGHAALERVALVPHVRLRDECGEAHPVQCAERPPAAHGAQHVWRRSKGGESRKCWRASGLETAAAH